MSALSSQEIWQESSASAAWLAPENPELVRSVVQQTVNADREHASDDDALVSEYWNAAQRLHWTRLQHQYVVVLRRQVMTPARTQAREHVHLLS